MKIVDVTDTTKFIQVMEALEAVKVDEVLNLPPSTAVLTNMKAVTHLPSCGFQTLN